MKKFSVTFQCSADDDVFCSNLVLADKLEDVEKEYADRPWKHIREAEDYELEESKRKGMPIITL